ncbi:Chromosome segregation protein sudA [Porphyridium purpureum]|uniref:Structural maintenance of chromosomes protein n=1 Tax=Porphyridium purpureum TaxID=35688 RepID=A0A5J4YXJ7_PORPP|nr:Chromosome segregation protein sudA [Porphyridium purpureum]|eukprot:POR7716..scf209_3
MPCICRARGRCVAMFITSITISGFKSYRDAVQITDLSPGHNVVVGRNGSGKSNFFDAIRFVLADAYGSLRAEERVALLHEGAGSSVLSAYVEIVFDNSLGRLPVEKDRVALRRIVGLKKDEYVLDRRNVTRAEVFNLLEAAGFSRSNPYYIMQQGKVATMCSMSNEARFELLKEVAGTRVYDERREESLRLMAETNSQREKIGEVIEYMEQRIAELESEKEELGKFQGLDKKRRALEYALLRLDLDTCRAHLEEIELQRAQEHERVAVRHSKLGDLQRDLKEQAAVRDRLHSQLRSLELRLNTCSQRRAESLEARATAEVELEELEEAARIGESERMVAQVELEAIERRITAKKSELETQLLPGFEAARAEEREVEEELAQREARALDLRATEQRRRKMRGRSERERTVLLQRELSEAEQERERLVAELAEARREAEQAERRVQTLPGTRSELEAQRLSIQTRLDELAGADASLKQRRAQAHAQRQELWRNDAQVDADIAMLADAKGKAERSLRSALGNQTAQALQCIRRAVEANPAQFAPYGIHAFGDDDTSGGDHRRRKQQQQQRLFKVYGAIYELVDVDSRFYTALETAAGATLSHVVVDTDETAAHLVRVLQREKAGRVTFIPLNRVSDAVLNRAPPVASQDAIALFGKLRFDARLRKVFMQLFGRTMIARDVKVAALVSAEQNVHCVTLDGDQVNKRGAMTGGFAQASTGRLEAATELNRASAALVDVSRTSAQTKQKVLEVESELSTVLGELQKLEVTKRMLSSDLLAVHREIELQQRLEADLAGVVDAVRERITTLDAGIVLAARQCESVRAEFEAVSSATAARAPVAAGLSVEEEQALAEASAAIQNLREVRLAEVAMRRAQIETRVNALQSELQNNLEKRADELRALVARSGTSASGAFGGGAGATTDRSLASELRAKRELMQNLIDELGEWDRELAVIHKEQDEKTRQAADAEKECERCEDASKTLEEEMSREQETMDTLFNQRSKWTMKKIEAERKIRDLGSLPADWQKYSGGASGGTSSGRLMKQLAGVNAELAQFGHVNKKALDQYMSFAERRDALIQRRTELESGARAIDTMIASLDERKENDILRTFRGVSKNFSEIFATMIPNGKAALVMLRGDEAAASNTATPAVARKRARGQSAAEAGAEDGVEEDALTATSGPLNYTGVAMKVSFHGSETFLLQQLSGGQKSLVAMTLIFAIQRLDPAPFYLFDEIDANLDSTYRAAVAELIKAQAASGTQFVTTTFRPEFVHAADMCFGVTHRNKLSGVERVSKVEALQFIQLDNEG